MLKHCIHGATGAICVVLSWTLAPATAAEPTPAVKHPDWLGIYALQVSPRERKALGIESASGPMVVGVYPGSPAEAGGLRPGDVIVSINAEPVTTAEQVATWQQRIRKKKAEALKFREKAATDLKKSSAELEKDLGPLHPSQGNEATVEYERSRRRWTVVLKGVAAPEDVHALTFVFAEKGVAWAQFEIAQRYRTGGSVTPDPAKARYWMEEAAYRSLPVAQAELATMLMTGEGGRKDPLQGVKLLERATASGHASIQSQLGQVLFEGTHVKRDLAAAEKWLNLAAEQNHASSFVLLGRLHAAANPPDHATALKWLRKAAEQKVAEADGLLGVHYQNGWGVEKSDAKAAEYFLRAANADHVLSQYMVGVITRDGLGVAPSAEVAFAWFELAAKNGDAPSQNELGLMCEKGTGVAANRDSAIQWFQKAAKQGNADAKANLKRLGVEGQ